MNLRHLAAGLLVGVLTLLVVTVGLAAVFAQYVWLSVVVAFPVGFVLGLMVTVLTTVGLAARAERRRTGAVSPRTARRFRAVAAATLGFLVVGGVAFGLDLVRTGVGLDLVRTGGVASATFTGVPVGLLGALVAGYLAFRLAGRGGGVEGDGATQ